MKYKLTATIEIPFSFDLRDFIEDYGTGYTKEERHKAIISNAKETLLETMKNALLDEHNIEIKKIDWKEATKTPKPKHLETSLPKELGK